MRLMVGGLRSARNKRTILSAGGVGVALVLIVLAARSGRTHDVNDRHAPLSTPPPMTEGPTRSSPPQQPQTGGGSLPLWLQILLAVIAVGVALAVVSYVTFFIVRLIRERRKPEKTEDDELGVDLADDIGPSKIATKLVAAVDQAIADLDQGETRGLIIACWMRFEDVAAGIGIARRPTETASDFTERVLATYDVNATVLAGLAELYREARFSAHEIDDAQRESARAALEAVRDDLVARRRAGVGATAGVEGSDSS